MFLHEEVTDRHWQFARDRCAAYDAGTVRKLAPEEWATLPLLLANIAAYGVVVAPDETNPVGEAIAFGRELPLVIDMIEHSDQAISRLVGDSLLGR